MSPKFKSLYSLSSLNNERIENLKELNITNLGDLLSYQPFRYARLIGAA